MYSEFRLGCCLYYLDKYKEAVKQIARIIKKHPDMPYLGEALYYIGISYLAMEEKDKAAEFLKQANHIVPENNPLHKQITEKLKESGGGEL